MCIVFKFVPKFHQTIVDQEDTAQVPEEQHRDIDTLGDSVLTSSIATMVEDKTDEDSSSSSPENSEISEIGDKVESTEVLVSLLFLFKMY